MQLQPATRTQQKIRLALQGDTGTGKTYGALMLAFGMTGNWSKVAVIDTESNSASFYAHMGSFNTIQLAAPFTPEKYIDAVRLCEEAGIEAIIIDSLSPEWMGEGGVLEVYCATEGDKAHKWDAIMPRHHVFIDAIVNSSAHVIVTVRSTPAKVLAEDGYGHYFMSVLAMDKDYYAVALKDRTQQLWGKLPTYLSLEVGVQLQKWCDTVPKKVTPELQARINKCKSLNQLYALLFKEDVDSPEVMEAFTKRRLEIDGIIQPEHPSTSTSANRLSAV